MRLNNKSSKIIYSETFISFISYLMKIIYLRANRNAKHVLEHDWSNKFEADRADNRAWSRKNGDVDIMYYAGAARYQEK